MDPCPPARPGVLIGRAAVLARAQALLAGGGRFLLGIAGPPGAGKSSLADWLAAELDARHGTSPRLVAQAPMDGFHLPNDTLARLGLADRKGAPETFDVAGYASLLARLRAGGPEEVCAPSFSRVHDAPVPGGHRIPATVRLVICEGNYLLLDTEAWAQVRGCCDETWFLQVDEEIARTRLIARHTTGGRGGPAARKRVAENDLENLRLVDRTAMRADYLVRLAPDEPGTPVP
ncbi:nucleoside/nucleotide kinase family protein [Frankia sp. QA3]|uniref:nucleoside/nucleotide kinase family protein n=1 Tax=Frankia sp. QA3 TaxID=710111 RepID=UPI000269CD10|nr:nucleoside/nucleotide kinase family protein [Frankia sp. QA3]EIV95635.1 panthothenate kinase [Frankia sp. QA3]